VRTRGRALPRARAQERAARLGRSAARRKKRTCSSRDRLRADRRRRSLLPHDSASRESFSPSDVAEMYRLRWEVELFSRTESGVLMDHVHRLRIRPRSPVSVTASMLAALLAAAAPDSTNRLGAAARSDGFDAGRGRSPLRRPKNRRRVGTRETRSRSPCRLRESAPRYRTSCARVFAEIASASAVPRATWRSRSSSARAIAVARNTAARSSINSHAVTRQAAAGATGKAAKHVDRQGACMDGIPKCPQRRIQVRVVKLRTARRSM